MFAKIKPFGRYIVICDINELILCFLKEAAMLNTPVNLNSIKHTNFLTFNSVNTYFCNNPALFQTIYTL